MNRWDHLEEGLPVGVARPVVGAAVALGFVPEVAAGVVRRRIPGFCDMCRPVEEYSGYT